MINLAPLRTLYRLMLARTASSRLSIQIVLERAEPRSIIFDTRILEFRLSIFTS